ncbi:class I SAM-dependent methyltransferase [Plantactinospora sp. WMMB334]|uniref:class I SAM-dependent methyltransferase n=1 Tax=Plantactinospora sp. WMMB334 TaxID=3404119 RepID=UPI003B96692E
MTAIPDSHPTADPYPMSNADAHSPDHHAALAELLDPVTMARLAELGDSIGTDWIGATCADVGSGGGSIAMRLADQVGDDGRVYAIDTDPDQIPDHPRLVRVQHDIRSGAPLPGDFYDLIVARLVLSHLPEREAILHRLVDGLAYDGTLMVADWAPLRDRQEIIVAAPSENAADLYATYQRTVGEVVFDAAGTDRGWARRIHTVMVSAGLVDVQTHFSGEYWTGGSAGTRFVAAIVKQVRPRLLAAGMTDLQLNNLLALLHDPGLVIHGHPLYITSGRRPG